MESGIDYDMLDDALRRCGSNWDAAQTHGLLSGRLAVAGVDGALDWLQQVFDGAATADSVREQCETMLNSLFESTHRQLTERLSEFRPFLPDDADSTARRAMALSHWCEGFLHGLVTLSRNEELRKALAEEPLAEIIRDMLQITRAAPGDHDEETDEAAYTELVEYLRVATQLTYEELAGFRVDTAAANGNSGTLH